MAAATPKTPTKDEVMSIVRKELKRQVAKTPEWNGNSPAMIAAQKEIDELRAELEKVVAVKAAQPRGLVGAMTACLDRVAACVDQLEAAAASGSAAEPAAMPTKPASAPKPDAQPAAPKEKVPYVQATKPNAPSKPKGPKLTAAAFLEGAVLPLARTRLVKSRHRPG